eukprot:CAMPEP_0181367340 /NCGR_PEP_ID=MMETSP1106-20121128/11327_1 /TAXON_ID=81844 /ORGANISM="Mantoniella antarctica, Strain SL-175" /LENGTH=95 /DNA_ID=CAMNT_0023483033 /DNA_START=556 /DNA_END=843 /DNA_ORIENTATION=+
MRPVSATADCWGKDRSSGGRAKSRMFAAVMPHFIVGAQKKIVLGPAGWFKKAAADCAIPAIAARRAAAARGERSWSLRRNAKAGVRFGAKDADHV